MMLRRSNLPEDMEMDILLRLPVKSLLRFRCVSKSWCARFQNPLFITNHYLKQTSLLNTNNNYANVSVHVTCEEIHSYPESDIPYFSLLDQTLSVKEKIYLPLPKHVKVSSPRIKSTGPCNGLICCLINHHQITLWNPATREFKHLPTSHIQRPPIAKFTLFNNIGFGFDSKTDDYKVICIFNNHCDNKIIQQVDLYTLSTNSWREVEFPFELLVCDNPMFNTYINGVYHWEERRAECIISFDMADEVFSRLQLPFNTSLNDYFWNLGLLNGYLAVIHYPNYPHMGTEMSFDIWVMKEYGVKESWTKQLAIGPISAKYVPIGFWKNGGLFLLSLNDKQLLLYDPNTQEIEKLQVHSPRLSARVVNYVESLVPINGRREHEDEHFIRFSTQMGDA